MSSADASHVDPELPDVDERLVAPESGYEIYDGKLVRAAPAGEARGTRLSKIVTLVEIHTRPELDVACGMLTRTSETSDIAPDVSVFPRARDLLTGGRQLEQLVFEVVSPESLGHAGRKAAKLIARGVRRVFAIDVEQVRALEWSASLAMRRAFGFAHWSRAV
jgi:Uma2 family endonuclease